MQYLWILILLIFSINSTLAQKPPETIAEFEKAYQRRIRQEVLNGVYIPKDIGEAFVELNRLIDKESKAKFKKAPEDFIAQKLHFSLGRWLIKNWGFYEGSRLSVYLNKIGVFHPDDLARFVIITYHRNLNRKSLDVENLVKKLLVKREKEEALRKENSVKKIISEETRKKQ